MHVTFPIFKDMSDKLVYPQTDKIKIRIIKTKLDEEFSLRFVLVF